MDIFKAVLNVLGVLVLVAVGAFLIVFLSDLVLSVIDRKNGIFFKTKGAKDAKALTYAPVKEEGLEDEEEEELELEYDETKPETPKKVDMVAAETEAEMVAKKVAPKVEPKKEEEKPAEPKAEPLDLNFDEFDSKKPEETADTEKEESGVESDDDIEKMYMDLINKINSQADGMESPVAAPAEKAEEETVEEPEVEEKEEEKEEVVVEVAPKDDAKVKELEDRLKELNSLLAIERENAEIAMKKSEELQKKLQDKKPEPANTESLEGLTERLAVLESRLTDAEKNFKMNKKEFIPLSKIKKTLESDKGKLRRKEAIVAKQKVLLFGVNNYVADPEKQKKLEEDLDVLDALRLSVKHCEDVMKENEDRYPILEKTHKILAATVADIKADIQLVQDKIKTIQGK